MSFSHFKNGIKDPVPVGIMNFNDLANYILANPNASTIDEIRRLRLQGNVLYRKIKEEQQNFTPHCMLKYRKLEGHFFERNFIDFSGYIFYDLDLGDRLDEVDSYIKYLISKYGYLASIICKSISGGGATIGFKIKNRIKIPQHFFSAISYITKNILDKEITYIDTSLYKIGQALYITSDPLAFVDFYNEIEVDLDTQNIIRKSINQYIMGYNNNYNIPIDTFLNLSLKQLLKHVKLETTIPVINRIVDLKRVEVAKIHYRKKKISDTKKHKAYTAIIHTLVYLNPDLHPAYIFAYLNYYNQMMSDPPMVYEKLESHFRFVFDSITNDKENDNYNYSNTKVKWVHTKKSSGISPEARNSIANKLNGKRRSNPSIEKIIESKKQLVVDGLKVTQKSVSERSGLSIATVKRYYKSIPVDLESYVEELNCYQESSQVNIPEPNNEYFIHPTCPGWVFRQDDNRIR